MKLNAGKMKKSPFYNSISTQAVIIVIGFTLASLSLSIYLYQESMKTVAIKEAENKATIFLSAIETSVRRFVMDKESKSLIELIEEQAQYLEHNLNFTIIRVIVRDSQGQILDHTRKEKIGELYSTDDFKQVMTSGRPLVKHQVKTLKLEPGQPETPVIEVLFPIINRKKGDVQAVVKIIIDVKRTFDLIHEEYKRMSRRVFLGFATAAVFLSLGIIFFLRRQIIAPVLSVVEGSSRVASGDLGTRLAPCGSNEISNLMQSFNQMVEGLKQREKMRQSLEVAEQVQQNLLPKVVPDFTGLDIAGTTIYCDETGGDYYDFIESGKHETGKIGIVIGDVSGHGIASALLMASGRAFLRQRSALPGSISQVISDINHQLTRDVADSGNFMSMFYLSIDKTYKNLRWVRAGHDPALFYEPKTKSILELKGTGIPLGVDANWQYEEYEKQNLDDGQIIVLGTDGIWEARNPKGDMFGKEYLYTLIKENSNLDANSILHTIIASLSKFQDNVKAEDDVTLIVIKISSQF